MPVTSNSASRREAGEQVSDRFVPGCGRENPSGAAELWFGDTLDGRAVNANVLAELLWASLFWAHLGRTERNAGGGYQISRGLVGRANSGEYWCS